MQEQTALDVQAAVDAQAPKARGMLDFFSELMPEDGILGRLFTLESAITAGRVLFAILAGLILVSLVVSLLKRITRKRMDDRSSALVAKIARYLGIALIAINAFDAANVDLSALLGAAGIAGIALGFAAQTTVSNFISGFFLVSEKTFAQGDMLNVDGTTGLVYAVDALSIKLRTFDNQLVRIPNETLIKTKVTNVTRFAARRLGIDIVVTYDTDVEKARSALMETLDANQDVLRNPEPLFMVKRFGDNGIELFVGAWFDKNDWIKGNNSLLSDIKANFDRAGIRFAYPSITLYAAEQAHG